MRKTVYKYIVTPTGLKAEMPIGAKVLTVQNQNGEVCIWAEVDPDAPTETRLFQSYGTGATMYTDDDISRVYIGTVQLEGGTRVFHVYEYTVVY